MQLTVGIVANAFVRLCDSAAGHGGRRSRIGRRIGIRVRTAADAESRARFLIRPSGFRQQRAPAVALWVAIAGLATWSQRGAASDDSVYVNGFEAGDCALPLTCPPQTSGQYCFAGQLRDAATTQPLHATSNVGLTCGTGASGGPCDLSLAAHDALAYEQNPGTSAPLASNESLVDGCGRFRFSGLSAPGSSGIAIVAQDAAGGSGHAPTATLRAAGATQSITGVNAVVATSTTVTSWFFLGQIADTTHGLILLSYTTGATRTVGVTVASGNPVGAIRYFSDADEQRLVASASATSTGADGSALVVNSPFQSFSGSSVGVACTSVMTASLPGIVVFAELACGP